MNRLPNLPEMDRLWFNREIQSGTININYNINITVNGTDPTPAKRGDRKMKTFVILSPGEDGYIVAECPSLPGCISQGQTKEEALANIREAIEAWLEVQREMDLPDLVEVVEVEV